MFCHRQVAFGLCVGAHLLLGGAAAAAQDWRQYRNERYGFTLQYPADLLVTERAAEAGDGQVFASSDDEARLLVGALPNEFGLHANYLPAIHCPSFLPGLPDRLSPHGRQLVCSLGRGWRPHFLREGDVHLRRPADQQLCHGLPLHPAPHLRRGGRANRGQLQTRYGLSARRSGAHPAADYSRHSLPSGRALRPSGPHRTQAGTRRDCRPTPHHTAL